MGRSSVNFRKDAEDEARRTQAWWGIAGLILTIAFGAISYILSDPVSQQTHRLVPAIAIDLWRLFVGAAIFVGLISVGGILFAVLSPKRKVRFSERELDKERKMIWAEQKVRKDRQKEMRKQIARARSEGK